MVKIYIYILYIYTSHLLFLVVGKKDNGLKTAPLDGNKIPMNRNTPLQGSHHGGVQ